MPGHLCPQPCDDLIVHYPIIQMCSAALHHIVNDSFLSNPFSEHGGPQHATVNYSNNTAKNVRVNTWVTDLRLKYAHTYTHTCSQTHMDQRAVWTDWTGKGREGSEGYCKLFPAETKIINRPLSEPLTIILSLYTDSPFSLMVQYVPLNIQLQAMSVCGFLRVSKYVCVSMKV